MGMFEKIFGNKAKVTAATAEYFKTLTAYAPAFYSFDGGLYEMDATRAAVHAIANQASKLKPHVIGNNHKNIERMLQFKPNPWMTTSQFLYRVATILECDNTAFIVPMYDKYGEVNGLMPVLPNGAEVVSANGKEYLRFTFALGQRGAVELSKVGILTKMQYHSDIFGESNKPLNPVLSLLDMNNQSIREGIKSAATIRFAAQLANSVRPEDLKKEQENFREMNLSAANNNGVMIFDQKYKEVKQILAKPYTVDTAQIGIINSNIYSYFGVNDKILKNDWDEPTWNAFYEGKLEPFALQLSMALTSMLFTEREIAFGCEVQFSANRLQFASNATKVSVITQMFDRGLMTFNEGREILQLPPVDDGDKFMIRGEYVNRDDKTENAPESGDAPQDDKLQGKDEKPQEVPPDGSDDESEAMRMIDEEIEKRAELMRTGKQERTVQGVEIRAFNEEGSEDMILEGYAAVFDQPTVLWKDENGVEFKEVIDRKAFEGTEMKKCCLKYNHESGVPVLARVRGGSMDLNVDDYGLHFRAKLFNTQTSRDIYEIVKAGGIDECSFAFTIKADEYDRTSHTRTIRSVDTLYDCAVVDNPAYGGTSVAARSFFEAEAEKERLESLADEHRREVIEEIKKRGVHINELCRNEH